MRPPASTVWAVADKQRRRELDRLADEIVPLLIARLGDSRLGELEIRDGDWRVRVRRVPRDARATARETARAGAAGGAGDHGRSRQGTRRESHETGARPPRAATAGQLSGRLGTPSGNGENAGLGPVGPGEPAESARGHAAADEPRRVVARAPAVGYYQPADGLSTGKILAADDVIGQIDVLGVRQAVTSPAAGIVSRLLAQAGEAVEYGQELLQIDVAPRADAAARRSHDARSGSS
jgi:biotin carboxyl carrier protein